MDAFRESIRQCGEFGYSPTYFVRMLDEDGAVGAARRLLRDQQTSDGFTRLWGEGRLGLTVEAIVLRPEFFGLFSRTELATARARLTDLGWTPPVG